MSRNGSGVYSLPSVYEVANGDDILPNQHNTPLEDLEADANDARPIVAGGTGATTALAARANLGISSTFASKAANYTVVTDDRGKVIEGTAGGGITLTLPPAATAGDGFSIVVIANGGNVNVDPDGSETINGSGNLFILDGGGATLFCDGSEWQSIGYDYTPTFGNTTIAGTLELGSSGNTTDISCGSGGLSVEMDPDSNGITNSFVVYYQGTEQFSVVGGNIAADGIKLNGGSDVLDYYEEGTWTPVVADASGGGNTATYTLGVASYTRIGRCVKILLQLSNITTAGMTGGNDLYIRGLPYTASADWNAPNGAVMVDGISTAGRLTPYIAASSTSFRLQEHLASSFDYTTVGEVTSGSNTLRLSFEYYV